MGSSIMVHIVYGVIAGGGEEEDPFWVEGAHKDEDEDHSFEEWILRTNGLVPLPYDTHPVKSYGYYTDPKVKVAYDEAVKVWQKENGYAAYYKKREAILKECPFDEYYGGYFEYEGGTESVLGIKSTDHAIYATIVDMPELVVSDWSIANANAYAEKFGIPIWTDPRWLVVASYG